MNQPIPRTCTVISRNGQRQGGVAFADLRQRPAYVLLGEPGAGKTTSFEEEAKLTGGIAISARDFLTLNPRPEWRTTTLFVDGLDEVRAGETNHRTPFDAIRAKLDLLDRPNFRISCREADWFGATDRDALARVSADGNVDVCHLDPLTDKQIEHLLTIQHGVADPKTFIERARNSRLESLLRNPQTLRMLTEAIQDRWPEYLKDAYDLACRKLVVEPNKEHLDAQRRQSRSVEDLLDTAGKLFAIQLLSNIAGFARSEAAGDTSHPTLASIGLNESDALSHTLASRLFEARGGEEVREPAHRSVAEYLGARHLADQIRTKAMPFGRIRALLVAGDGGIVSDLRGLHAWLAVHLPEFRTTLIDEDPLGVLLQGDAKSFPPEHKRHILNALAQEAHRYAGFRFQDWTDHPFGALADRALLPDLREILTSDVRNEAHEALLDCTLEALVHGEPLPELDNELLTVARDPSHWGTNRRNAIEAHHHTGAPPFGLLGLLEDIRTGGVIDPEDELTGALLRLLYPEHLPASRVVDYLHPSKNPRHIGGRYSMFWEYSLMETTTHGQWAELLDGIARDLRRLPVSHEDFEFRDFAGELLARAIESDGNSVEPARLWQWLAVGLDPDHAYSHLETKHEKRISRWLSARPATYIALMDIALRNCAGVEQPCHCLFAAEHRLHEAIASPEVGDWCFARAAEQTNADIRQYLIRKGILSLLTEMDWTPQLLDALLEQCNRFPSLQDDIDNWLTCEWEDWRKSQSQRKREHQDNRTDRLSDWRQHFQKHRATIAEGTAPPGVMYDMARIYFGRFSEAKGDTPTSRFDAFFDNAKDIRRTALAGLRNTLYRNDLPSVTDIIDLHSKGRHHYIAEPCLAGAQELFAADPEAVLNLPTETQKRLIAFRLTHDFDDTPTWYLAIIGAQPSIAAEVLIEYAKAMFKARKEHIAGIYPLAHEEALGPVAKLAALPLLAAFPIRAKKELLAQLSTLLTAATKHTNRDDLQNLIATKLATASLDSAQRGHWLAAGFAINPAAYEKPLARYMGNKQSRAIQIAGVFDGRLGRAIQLPELSESALGLLIRLIGPHTTPERPQGAHHVTAELNAADFVRSVIAQLSAIPTADATNALRELLKIDDLRLWHHELRHRMESQRLLRREAEFRRQDAPTIVKVLENGPPANAADLRELMAWHLRDLAYRDRDAAGIGYLRYWNTNSYGRPETPKRENECRYRLLETLQERLRPTSVDLQPEGQYHENMRADIRANFGGANGLRVPIEIKCDDNKHLWKAMRGQLMAHYAIEPGADGNGIYLVFWFGGKGMPAAADGGSRPKSASELEERLRNTLTPDEQRRIEVIVVDCAPT